MELLKTAVRRCVLVFVFVATAVTFAGLNPDSKAEIGELAKESLTRETYKGTGDKSRGLSSAETKKNFQANINAAG